MVTMDQRASDNHNLIGYHLEVYCGGWDKRPSLSIVFGLSSKTQWLSGLYHADFISFTALLNCAEVGRRNRILTSYRFLSHSLIFLPIPQFYYEQDQGR